MKRITNHKQSYLALLLSATFISGVLTGCESGGNGATTTVTPANNSTGIELNTVVTATFAEDIFAVTVDDTSFTLSDGSPIGGTVDFDAMTNVASFTPSDNLTLLTNYNAKLDNTITNLSGDALVAMDWSFTTRDGVWGDTPSLLSDGVLDTNNAQIAFDTDGNAMLVWGQKFDAGNHELWARYYIASSNSWNTAQLIGTDNQKMFNPQVTIDSNDNAWVIWRQDISGSNIHTRRYIATSSSWETTVSIDSGSVDQPQIVVDDNGNAIAVWKRYGAPNSIYFKHYTAGSGWGSTQPLENDTINHANAAQIAMDSNGNALAVWEQNSGGFHSIWSRYYTAATNTWGDEILAESADSNATYSPKIAFDASGAATVVWQMWDGTRTSLYANRYTPGTGWGTVEVIENDDTGEAFEHKIALDADGNALVVWEWHNDDDVEMANIWSSSYTVASGWDSENVGPINIITTSYAASPQISFDARGNALAVWQWDENGNGGISFNRFSKGSGWATAEDIDNASGYALSPKIAIESDGSATAVWRQTDGTRYNIMLNRFE